MKQMKADFRTAGAAVAITAGRNLTVMRVVLLALVFAAAVLASTAARAQYHGGSGGGHGNGGPGPGAHVHLDNHFSHNHYYYDRGYQFHGAPRGGIEIHHGGQNFWYDRGQWYRRRGDFSVVIGAPFGAFVPVLPLYYSTVWWGGVPYYYADDTYYTWDADQDAYEVVQPPSGIDSGGTTQAPASDKVFVYPKNGQTADQQERDTYECHRSAVEQTGFDPTLSGGGVPADSTASKRSDYLRAQGACLDARGYSVK
jgi:hypothetical protein